MLSERFRRALSAFVDGELTPHQRKAVLRLVRRSPEARKYLLLLRQDSSRLHDLPKKRLGLDFSDRVLKTIAQRQLPKRRSPAPRPVPVHTMPVWAGLAAAASVLLMIGFSSYAFFLQTVNPGQTGPSLVNKGDSSLGSPDPKDEGESGHSGAVVKEGNQTPDHIPDKDGSALAQGSNDNPQLPVISPMESLPKGQEAFTLPIPKMELFGPRTADVDLPVIQKLTEINTAELRDKFQKDSGFRVEMPCLNSVRAFERLQIVLKARGISLFLDGAVQNRLKQSHLHTNFVVFSEDLTGEELVQLLEQMAIEDKKAAAKPKGEAAFNGLIITRMDKDDRMELGDLLGIDAKQVQTPKPAGPLNLDPKTPIQEVTAAQVIQALSNKGSSPRGTEPAKAGDKKPEQRSVLLPFNPVRLLKGSPEVKKFLDGRKPLRSGAVQVLLVVREVKS